ncbi:MAG: site-specific integrase [Alphaproteobacteria bacterium]|nr:site-specific integrase [Alphaproteobacteria bacterium]
MADSSYLQKKGNTWRVVVEIPKPLRVAAGGKPRFMRSLGTESLTEANRLKHAHVAEFRRRIALLERGRADPLAQAIEAAISFREALAAPGVGHMEHGDHESTAEAEMLATVRGEAEALLEAKGPEVARLFHSLATGQAALIRDHYETWLTTREDTEQTKSQHKGTIERYLRWAGEYTSIQATDRRKAGEYVQALRDAGLAPKTIGRHLSSLSGLWRHLISRALTSTEVNPWLGHGVTGSKSKKVRAPKRKGLPNEKLLLLLHGRYSTPHYATVLADLLRLALLHGSRIDELCSLKRADITKRKDGYWYSITDGKTEASVREVPVHTLAVPIIERRLKGTDEYLFPKLVPGGRDQKRSWNVSKAYGRFRKQVGVSGKYEDFHALRKTFASLAEGLEIPESTVKLIIGHERGDSITYGVYSDGKRLDLRKVIDRIDYGPEVTKAIIGA